MFKYFSQEHMLVSALDRIQIIILKNTKMCTLCTTSHSQTLVYKMEHFLMVFTEHQLGKISQGALFSFYPIPVVLQSWRYSQGGNVSFLFSS